MYRRTIEVNPFSSKSINSAIMSLQREKKRRDEFLAKLMEKLAERIDRNMNVRLNEVYRGNNGDYELKVTHDKESVHIDLNGSQVAFIEFGAGTSASNGTRQSLGFDPGSWSWYNKSTYQIWELSRGVRSSDENGRYKYEQEAAHSFDMVLDDFPSILRLSADEACREVYGK